MLNFVVIGVGQIGPRHAQSIAKHKDCKLFAVVDHSVRGPDVAKRFDCLLFQDVEEMLQHCRANNNMPDAAVICTPNHTHAFLGTLLAENKINVLVEKPMAANADDCRTLTAACRKHDVKLLVGHHRRFHPKVLAIKDNMSRIGKPVAIQGVWALKKAQSYFDDESWRRSKKSGGGALLTNLVHDLDLFIYLLGPIVRVYADLLPQRRTPDDVNDQVDEGAVLTLRFANGCCGTFLCSDNVVSPFSFEASTGENPIIPYHEGVSGVFRVFGSEGTLSLPDSTVYHQDELSSREKSWWKPMHEEHVKANSDVDKIPFDSQIEHFVNLITGAETEVKCSGPEATLTLNLMEAVSKSIETGQPQDVDCVNIG